MKKKLCKVIEDFNFLYIFQYIYTYIYIYIYIYIYRVRKKYENPEISRKI